MKITLEWLKENKACEKSIEAWQDYGLESLDIFDCIERLKVEQKNIAENYDNENSLMWATWMLPRTMKKLSNVVEYSKFCSNLAAASAASAEWAESAARAAAEWAGSAARAAASAELAARAEWAARAAASAELAARAEWAAAASDETSLKIIDYGIKLLKEELKQSPGTGRE